MSYDKAALIPVILERFAEGRSLRAVLREGEGMPSVGHFLRWVAEDPQLAEQYARARSACLDAMAEDIIDIADTPEIGQKTVSKVTGLETTEGDMVEHRRLRIDSRKWLLAKLAPKKYGDKQHIEHSVDTSLADRLARARKRADGTGD